MTTFICHADTEELVTRLSDDLPQGILLKGAAGVGLLTTARRIAGKALVNIVRPTDRDGNIMEDGSGEIRIAQIRELVAQTRGISTTRRVIIIDDADRMNLPAQQAFLKLLEEPTDNTHFILTAHISQVLLPTIRSRVQSHLIKPISPEQSLALIQAYRETDQRRIQQLLFLAEGRPAELATLLQDKAYFARQVTAVEDARQLLQGSGAARVGIVQKYQSDRPGTLLMLEQAIRIIRATLKRQPTPKIIASADHLAQLHQRITANGSIRLQLLDFVVQ